MAKKNPYLSKLKMILPEPAMVDRAGQLSELEAQELLSYINRPGMSLYVDRTVVPHALTVSTSFGAIHLDHTLQNVDKVYVGRNSFEPVSNDISVMSTLLDGNPIDAFKPRNFKVRARNKRGRRVARGIEHDRPFEEMQAQTAKDLSGAALTYNSLFLELADVFADTKVDISDIARELTANGVDEKNIGYFLAYESAYKREIISNLYGLNYGEGVVDYNFKPVVADPNTFIGKLMNRLEVDAAEYDEESGVLKIDDRLITNLPKVDERGVFSNGNVRYIPYHIGYFVDAGPEMSRVDRLRHIDPVERAISAVELQYKLTRGDIKFKTILDVTRNLPDFDNHPYGDEILETLKRKVVLDKSYTRTNSLVAEYQNRADELGAVALTMLDEDAKGLIDPLGTSNGANMGIIFYLTEDAEFNPDGTFVAGRSEHSPVGNVMKQFEIDKDNFNRHQMSFNAMLTSSGVQKLKVAYAEFALWNSEDAVVLTEKGAQSLAVKANSHDLEGMIVIDDAFVVSEEGEFQPQFVVREDGVYRTSQTGDKVTDMHGNKSVSSLVIDPNMDEETAKDERLQYAVEFAKLNPDVDMVVSPVSLASRLNMGVAHEGLVGEKSDLHLPDGTVVKDGVVEIAYMTLPQTAEHKSKDYGVEGNGRKYSTLFRYALSSKVGDDLYRKGIVREEVRNEHIDEVATAFDRLGISFKNEKELLKDDNIEGFVPSRETVSASDLFFKSPSVIHRELTSKLVNNAINIDLGSRELISPMTGQPIKDAEGKNVLPIRVEDGKIIPYRYTNVFKQLAIGNVPGLQEAYNHAVAIDYNHLTDKNNIIKNIDTMTVFDGSKTEMMSPDPRLKLGQVATSVDDKRVIVHRDPCIQSGNVISMENVGGNKPNMTHINPLIVGQMNGDFDSDTVGVNAFKNLTLSEEDKNKFFEKSNVYEQLNRYGEVFLGTGESHFVAASLANGLDTSNVTFEDGKSNRELAAIVEDLNAQIIDSPKSYGAYALSFENEHTLKDSLGRLADDGIKGNRADIERHFEQGYSIDEDRAVMKALIAKSEWTGLAGSTTNKLIAGFGDKDFDQELTRVALDVTYAMTQSVLQMKKNADKLPEIDKKITRMKTVMNGKFTVEESRRELLDITDGLAPADAINKFVDVVADRQAKLKDQGLYTNDSFGTGVLHSTGASNAAFAFMSETTFTKHIAKQIFNDSDDGPEYEDTLSDEELAQIMAAFEQTVGESLEGGVHGL